MVIKFHRARCKIYLYGKEIRKCVMQIKRYLIECVRRVSGITFIRHVQKRMMGKPN